MVKSTKSNPDLPDIIKNKNGKCTLSFRNKQKFCGGEFTLFTKALHTEEQARVVRNAVLDALSSTVGCPLPGDATPIGTTKQDIKEWKDIGREAAKVAKAKWEKQNPELVTPDGQYPCGHCEGTDCSWRNNKPAMIPVASNACARKFLKLHPRPDGSGGQVFVYTDPYQGNQICEVDTSRGGQWTKRSGELFPCTTLRIAPRHRGYSAAAAAIQSNKMLNDNATAKVKSDNADVTNRLAFNLQRRMEAAQRKSDRPVCDNPDNLYRYDEVEGATPPKTNTMSADAIAASIMKASLDAHGDNPNILRAVQAFKGSADWDPTKRCFIIRYKEELAILTDSARSLALLSPIPGSEFGENFVASNFSQHTPGVNVVAGKIDYLVTFQVFDSSGGRDAAFHSEIKLDAAISRLPCMNDPNKSVVHLNEAGGGKGNRLTLPGFGVAGIAVICLPLGKFTFNLSRSFSLGLMKKVPKHFRISMPTAPEVKAVKERKKKTKDKRHGQRKTERDMKVNAILGEANAEANVGKNDGATAQLKSPPEKIILGSGKSPTDVMALPSSEADSAASSKPAAGVGKLELGGSDSPFVPIKAEADSAASGKPAAGVYSLFIPKTRKRKADY